MKPLKHIPTNSENQSKSTLFVFLMTKFVTKGTDAKQRHLTLQLKNEENLGCMGKASVKPVPSRQSVSAFAEMPRAGRCYSMRVKLST